MSIFEDVSKSNKEDHNYPYYKYIRTPSALGASSAGNLTALGNDINALTDYVDVLVSGTSRAQTVSPIGNKYFLDTGATCFDATNTEQSRNIYINNIPDGSIPFLPGSSKGLVPGVLEDIAYINPFKIFTAFSKGTACQQITMNTRTIENATSTDSKYVLLEDIADYNPCWFPDNKNPVTNEKCSEGMSTLPQDFSVQAYASGITILGIYIVTRLLQKH